MERLTVTELSKTYQKGNKPALDRFTYTFSDGVYGLLRPVGSQNEAVFHCRWGFDRGKRGQLNNWLVAWPCAFRLSVLAEEAKPE